jgi:uncharacterized protein YchJ
MIHVNTSDRTTDTCISSARSLRSSYCRYIPSIDHLELAKTEVPSFAQGTRLVGRPQTADRRALGYGPSPNAAARMQWYECSHLKKTAQVAVPQVELDAKLSAAQATSMTTAMHTDSAFLKSKRRWVRPSPAKHALRRPGATGRARGIHADVISLPKSDPSHKGA